MRSSDLALTIFRDSIQGWSAGPKKQFVCYRAASVSCSFLRGKREPVEIDNEHDMNASDANLCNVAEALTSHRHTVGHIGCARGPYLSGARL